MPGLATYWHTLRHLRPVQFYGRLRFRFVRPTVDLRPAPAVRQANYPAWVLPARRRISMVGRREFRLLGESRTLDSTKWNDPSIEKLWLYNLHYFDDLNAFDAPQRTEWQADMLVEWVRENRPGIGIGWEPYPTSLRVVNWIKWSLGGGRLDEECRQSLAVQVRWLSRRPEFHLLGNHLFANAKALVFAGLYFDGLEAETWLGSGMRILERELTEQILPDGGQFERSTMYQALALEDMLDLTNVFRIYAQAIPKRWRQVASAWPSTIGAMRRWIATMCHPDGEISFFNDAAFGIAPTPAELDRYASDLGLGPTLPVGKPLAILPDSGYIRIERGAAVALLDLAPVGPDYLPGHAHADTLSFELSLFGRRLMVNSGTSHYGDSAERHRQRGTAAHNTVVIDGENSSEVWAGFRVARRAHATILEARANGAVVVRGEHDGYARLPGRPRHVRQWTCADNTLEVEDRIIGEYQCAEARFHLHPSVAVDNRTTNGEAAIEMHTDYGSRVRFEVSGGVVTIEPSTWHFEFGVSLPTVCLAVKLTAPALRTRITWSDPS